MKNRFDPRDILVSHILLTRLPIPRLSDKCFARQNHAVWAFPLAGISVATLCVALAYIAAILGFSAPFLAGLVLITSIVLTGAMHEDGLADVADGFWGGFDRARRLEIMKDSHIGTYGVLALIMVSIMRWSALSSLFRDNGTSALWLLLPVAALSRAVLPAMMYKLPDARPSGLAQSVGRPGLAAVIAALFIALVTALLILGPFKTLVLSIVSVLIVLALAFLALRKIGGKTGDVLGTAQQLTELSCLLALVALI
ncbi:adenosylcobinamide-GDP ribazoletransferase [Epibacterium sp. SM1969]|uniref:Adenosylcobinamide-GDP ribazoletransferase n=1 Tax=Tritonibacter aquimaris TaxID=2663379 RepID=A0A844APM7_9RHOB|nr:adenosylcobinamide-GDP ribazoletransferase [Tritonibacter aquimaris]MQY42703.1 adenosylcobinamide-GDP ribazoletransferase [Tritonibacter aquimaris]